MELILMRHGTTQGNLERRFIGTLDVPLLPQGEELARRVGATLPAVEHIYRSPLQRCRRTAELLWPGVEMTVVDEHIAHHKHLCGLYRELLADVEGITFHENPSGRYDSNYWLNTVLLDENLHVRGEEDAYR